MDSIPSFPLSKRQIEILQIMVDNRDTEDGLIIYSKGIAYIGLERIASRTVFALIRNCCISLLTPNCGVAEYYKINEIGINRLKEK